MPILTIAYGEPTDSAAFDRYYETTHRPLAEKVPRVVELAVRRCSSLDDNPAPYYLLAQLNFASEHDLQSALTSVEGQAAAADLANFATGGATLFVQHD